MKTKPARRSISEPSDPSKTLWSDFLIFRNSKSEAAVNRASGDFPEHLHEFAEISFILSGSSTHRLGRAESRISEGDFVVARPGDRHSYGDSSRDFRRLNVQIRAGCFEETLERLRESGLEPEVFEGGYQKLAGRRGEEPALPPDAFSECVRLANAMEAEWLAAAPGFPAFLKFKFGELALLIARTLSRAGKEAAPSGDRRLFDAIELVDKEYSRQISVEELERKAGMGRRTLERAFKAETGLSPKSYILKTRLAWACRLLANGGLSIQEAAAACGFKGQNYFTRAFKQSLGLTPGQFVAERKAKG